MWVSNLESYSKCEFQKWIYRCEFQIWISNTKKLQILKRILHGLIEI